MTAPTGPEMPLAITTACPSPGDRCNCPGRISHWASRREEVDMSPYTFIALFGIVVAGLAWVVIGIMNTSEGEKKKL